MAIQLMVGVFAIRVASAQNDPGPAPTGELVITTDRSDPEYAVVDDENFPVEFELQNAMDIDYVGGSPHWNHFQTAWWWGGETGYFYYEEHASENQWFATDVGLSTELAVYLEDEDETESGYADTDDEDWVTYIAYQGQPAGPVGSQLSSIEIAERISGNPSYNKLTITGMSGTLMYACPGNEYNINIYSTSLLNPVPLASRVRFYIDGSSTPSSGTFAAGNVREINWGETYDNIYVGFDFNNNGSLDVGERAFWARVGPIDVDNAVVKSRRTSTTHPTIATAYHPGGIPTPQESLHVSNEREHFDIGSTFQFVLDPGAGDAFSVESLINYEVINDDESTSTSGVNVSKSHVFGASDEGDDIYVRFWLDCDGDFNYDWPWEDDFETEYVDPTPIKVHTFDVEVSDLVADTISDFQDRADESLALALSKDSDGDYRACVYLDLQNVATQFVSGGARPDPATYAEVETHHYDVSGFTFYIFDDIDGYYGRADDIPGSKIAIDWPAINAGAGRPSTIVHELGHMVGENHYGPADADNIRSFRILSGCGKAVGKQSGARLPPPLPHSSGAGKRKTRHGVASRPISCFPAFPPGSGRTLPAYPTPGGAKTQVAHSKP